MRKYFHCIRVSHLVMAFLVFHSFFLQAQDEKPKFGKISTEDLAMTRYDLDTSAEAVVLSDIGSSYFDYDKDKGFVLMHERFLRIKILKQEGYPQANQSISLYKQGTSREILSSLKASTFNLVNRKPVESKMENSSVFEGESDLNWVLKKFTLPAVKVGSVMDIRYTIESPFFFNLQPWSFQNVIPERYSEYEIRIPEYFHYKKQVSGFQPFVVNETTSDYITKNFQEFEPASNTYLTSRANTSEYEVRYREDIFRLAARDVPAMKSEKFTNSIKNYHTRVEFELNSYQFPQQSLHDLTSSWEQIVHKLLSDDDFGGQLKRTGLTKDIARAISMQSNIPEEKMELAYSYIRTNLTWDRKCSIWPSTNLHRALNERKGNSADVNLTLILLLKELGINANPILLSTRSNGIICENTPNLTRLNYVIAQVPLGGKQYLLDATDPDRSSSMLPFRCLNGKGILAIEDSVKWIDLLNAEKNSTRYYGEFKFTPEGALTGKMNVTYDGYPANDNREELRTKGNEEYIRSLKQDIKNGIADSIRIEGKELSAPFKLSYNLESQEMTQNSGNMIFFNALLGMSEATNPLAPPKREYPVDFGCPLKASYIFIIEIPEGYSVESLPQKAVLSLPNNGGSFKFTVSQVGNKIAVNSIFSLSKTFFLMSEYPDLREFYSRMIAKQAEKIVLKKTS